MIDLKDVEITLSKKKIIDHVNIDVDSGEFVGLIGPNGSGKSTLLKATYRVLKKYEGAILIDGTDIKTETIHASALKTAVVPQHSYSNFDFTVRDVVLMGRAPHKKAMEFDNQEDYAIADEALAKVGMTEFADRSFYTLSGGEQQRIVLARAMAQQTKCMVLDEPTNHLDVKYQLQLMDIVKSLNVTVLCALHDLNIAGAYCDKLYLLKDGKVYCYGTPEEVLTPENILNVYGVHAVVTRSPNTGLLNIEYVPAHAKIS
ncbi:MAG: ABC transporter ATP-binding protein [Candidatus Methanomethylophilus sp.]|nr:ABC transporter ATP-binding protein [Methanomethylophilus sp.]